MGKLICGGVSAILLFPFWDTSSFVSPPILFSISICVSPIGERDSQSRLSVDVHKLHGVMHVQVG